MRHTVLHHTTPHHTTPHHCIILTKTKSSSDNGISNATHSAWLSPLPILNPIINLFHSGYVTREDRNRAPSNTDTNESYQPPVLSKGDGPVDGGDGVCATFLFELPMGNASSLYNQPMLSAASTTAPSSSSSSSPKPPVSQVGPGVTPSPRTNGTGSSSSSSSSSSGTEKSLSYGQRAHRMQEDNEEAYRRQSRLCPSFSTSQQVSTALHHTVRRRTAWVRCKALLPLTLHVRYLTDVYRKVHSSICTFQSTAMMKTVPMKKVETR